MVRKAVRCTGTNADGSSQCGRTGAWIKHPRNNGDPNIFERCLHHASTEETAFLAVFPDDPEVEAAATPGSGRTSQTSDTEIISTTRGTAPLRQTFPITSHTTSSSSDDEKFTAERQIFGAELTSRRLRQTRQGTSSFHLLEPFADDSIMVSSTVSGRAEARSVYLVQAAIISCTRHDTNDERIQHLAGVIEQMQQRIEELEAAQELV